VPVPGRAGYQTRVVASGLIEGTVRTPTARAPVGSGSSDGARTGFAGVVEVVRVGETVERELAWRSAEVLPHAESMIVMPIPTASALVKVLRCISVGISVERGVGAYCVDDFGDRPARASGGALVFGQHRVRGVRQQLVDAVGRQRGELVLRG